MKTRTKEQEQTKNKQSAGSLSGGRGGITVDKQEEKETKDRQTKDRQTGRDTGRERQRDIGGERNTYTDSLGERRAVEVCDQEGAKSIVFRA